MQIENTGEVTLTGVSVTPTGATTQTTNCGTTAELAPGASKNCTLTATAGQDDYDAGTLAIAASTSPGHKGLASLTLSGTNSASASLSLNHSASMSVTVTSGSTITQAGAGSDDGWLQGWFCFCFLGGGGGGCTRGYCQRKAVLSINDKPYTIFVECSHCPSCVLVQCSA
jgi:uncharacterized membrane protein